jgi:hypothetical protein
MRTVNITIKINEHELTNFEYWLRQQLEVVSFKVIPDTAKLYETNQTFKKLVKKVKIAQEERDNFINEYNV